MWQEVAREIESFVRSRRNWPQVALQGGYWISDAYLLAMEFELALAKFPNKPGEDRPHLKKSEYLDTRYKQTTFKPEVGKYLEVKRFAEEEVKGREIVTLGSSYALTDYGIKNIERLPDACEVVLNQRRNELGIRVIDHIMHRVDFGSRVFLRTIYTFTTPREYLRSWRMLVQRTPSFIKSTLTRSENIIRQEDGLPLLSIGTSRGEENLYSLVQRWFKGEDVLRHARFDWLGKQHLDVFIPSINVGIEYQGEQHEAPIEHFGGIEGLKNRQELDARKRRLCAEYGVRLLYLYPDYDEHELKDLLLG